MIKNMFVVKIVIKHVVESVEFDLFGVAMRPFDQKTEANRSKSRPGPFGLDFEPI